MYRLLGRNSQLTLENKILLHKTVLKPIWTRGIQFWGTAARSNVECKDTDQRLFGFLPPIELSLEIECQTPGKGITGVISIARQLNRKK